MHEDEKLEYIASFKLNEGIINFLSTTFKGGRDIESYENVMNRLSDLRDFASVLDYDYSNFDDLFTLTPEQREIRSDERDKENQMKHLDPANHTESYIDEES